MNNVQKIVKQGEIRKREYVIRCPGCDRVLAKMTSEEADISFRCDKCGTALAVNLSHGKYQTCSEAV